MSEDALAERMRRLGIRDVDLEETFARSRGPGGQHVNKVSTAVTLRHRPSGISVTVQDSRSQAMNRKLARERWLDAGVLLKRTRDYHNHNASNHCDYAAAAHYPDHNNAYDGRLLSA